MLLFMHVLTSAATLCSTLLKKQLFRVDRHQRKGIVFRRGYKVISQVILPY